MTTSGHTYIHKDAEAGQAENDVACRYGAISRLIIPPLNNFIFKYQSLCSYLYKLSFVVSHATAKTKKSLKQYEKKNKMKKMICEQLITTSVIPCN